MTVTRKVLEQEVKKVMDEVCEKTRAGLFNGDDGLQRRNTYALIAVEQMLSQLLSTRDSKIIVQF